MDVIAKRQEPLANLVTRLFGQPRQAQSTPHPSVSVTTLLDREILELASRARNGTKFRALYDRGDTSEYGGDDSAADAALVAILVFYTDDDSQVERLFAGSALGTRDKWKNRPDYRKATIDSARALVTKRYTPKSKLTSIEGGKAKSAASDVPPSSSSSGKSVAIDVEDEDLDHVTKLAWDGLCAWNEPPSLFLMAGIPMRLVIDETNNASTEPLTDDRLRFSLAQAIYWKKTRTTEKGTFDVPAMPPMAVVRNMLATPNPPLPRLDRIVASPVFGPNGELQTEPGYHRHSRTYYNAKAGTSIPAIPSNPSIDDVNSARNLILNDLLVDFPFVSDADRANAVGEFLLVPARAMIDGTTPIHIHEAPTPGTGKDLLAEAMSLVFLGELPTMLVYTRDAGEFSKKLLTTLLKGPEWVVLPNVSTKVDNDQLCNTISRGQYQDRILGVSDSAAPLARNVWTITSNNARLSTDFVRRATRVRLDAGMVSPEDRTEFKHPKLHSWVREHRVELISAGLMLVQSWIANGKPEGKVTRGGFEDWATVIGGILEHAGINGFLENAREFRQAVDTDAQVMQAFVSAWWEKYHQQRVGVAALFPIASSDDLPLDLGDKNERSQRIRLGQLLSNFKDRLYRINEHLVVRIVKGEIEHKTQQWKLESVSLGDMQVQHPLQHPPQKIPSNSQKGDVGDVGDVKPIPACTRARACARESDDEHPQYPPTSPRVCATCDEPLESGQTYQCLACERETWGAA